MKINDMTYAVRGAVFEVNRVLGPGFLEKVYEKALLMELRKRGLKADYAIEYRWTTVHVLFKLSLVYLQISYYNIIINHIHYATCCVGIEKEIYNA